MAKKNNQLKVLASLAKKRLMRGEYEEPTPKDIIVPSVNSYFIKNAQAMKRFKAKVINVSISGEIDHNFRQKVYDILDNDYYDLCPLAKLVDGNIYTKLNEIEKQSYILKLAEQYSQIKADYIVKEKEVI